MRLFFFNFSSDIHYPPSQTFYLKQHNSTKWVPFLFTKRSGNNGVSTVLNFLWIHDQYVHTENPYHTKHTHLAVLIYWVKHMRKFTLKCSRSARVQLQCSVYQTTQHVNVWSKTSRDPHWTNQTMVNVHVVVRFAIIGVYCKPTFVRRHCHGLAFFSAFSNAVAESGKLWLSYASCITIIQ